MKSITRFAIPCILTRLIQNLYPLIDSVIVGKLLNVESLAAVGVAGSIYALFNDTMIGLVSGFAVVAGKKYGAEKKEEVTSVYANALILSVLCSIMISGFGMIFSVQMLNALQTPADLIPFGKQYLFVMFLGFLPNALYNFYCEMMRALGNSKKPLYLLVFSSFLHLFLIVPLTMALGIYGAALATVISYVLTDLLAGILINKGFSIFRFKLCRFRPDKAMVKECLSIGFPMALTNLVVMLGVLFLNLVTNSIGTDYIAAYSSASKIGYIITTPIFGFATAVAVFTSQNFGAKNYHRISEGINKTLRLVLVINVVLWGVAMFACKPILGFILSNNQTAVHAGMLYLFIRCCAMFILAPALFYKSVLPSLGKPFFSTLSGFLEIGIRFIFPFLFSSILGFASVPLTDACTWVVLAVMLFFAYRHEWKKIKELTL